MAGTQKSRTLGSLTNGEVFKLNTFLKNRTLRGSSCCCELARRLGWKKEQVKDLEYYEDPTEHFIAVLRNEYASREEPTISTLIEALSKSPPMHGPISYLKEIDNQPVSEDEDRRPRSPEKKQRIDTSNAPTVEVESLILPADLLGALFSNFSELDIRNVWMNTFEHLTGQEKLAALRIISTKDLIKQAEEFDKIYHKNHDIVNNFFSSYNAVFVQKMPPQTQAQQSNPLPAMSVDTNNDKKRPAKREMFVHDLTRKHIYDLRQLLESKEQPYLWMELAKRLGMTNAEIRGIAGHTEKLPVMLDNMKLYRSKPELNLTVIINALRMAPSMDEAADYLQSIVDN